MTTPSPLFNHGAEDALLGCCLVDADATETTIARARAAGVTAASFDDPRNARLWMAINRLQDESPPVTDWSLAEDLRARGEIEQVGGVPHITELTAVAPTSLRASHYIEIVRDLARRRALDGLAARLREGLASGALGTHEAVEEIRAGVDALAARDPLAIEARRFDLAKPPPPSEPRFYLKGVPVWTAGNLGALAAMAKGGKSSVIGANLAAVMLYEGTEADCLGFSAAPNTHGHAVVHVDTEQSPDDHHSLVKRCLARARLAEPPPWFLSYCLTGLDAHHLRESLPAILKRALVRFGGIHSVFVDGVADMAADVNDPAESNSLVAEWHALAIRYHCPIIGVIHVNPGQNPASKTRGHLGSQLERKAETNMKIEREKDDDAFVVCAEKNRRAPIMRSNGARFAWSEQYGMHVTVRVAPPPDLVALAKDIFDGEGEIGANHAQRNIQEMRGVSNGTAKNRWREIVAHGIVTKTTAGRYRLI